MSITSNEAAVELLKRRRGRDSLIGFTEYTKPDFKTNWHHKRIADELEAVEQGRSDRLMIFAPPRHTKSELASRRFPAWYLGRHPDKQLICSTYSGDFALDFGRDVRGIVAGEEYARLFPEVTVSADSRAANRWQTNKGGISVYVGVGGPITGRGADIAIIDDPFKNREEADSEARRESVWRWYTSTLRTRLMPGGAIVIVLTRWHEDDLAGRLLERSPDEWKVVELPAISGEGTDREEALWPEWYPIESLKRIKADVGSREWSALYQQRPQPDDGTYFKREWFRWYSDRPSALSIYIVSDYAVTEGGGDWTEHGVMGVNPDGDIYVLDWWTGQSTADVWIDKLLDLVHQYKPMACFGETGPIKRAIEPFLIRRSRERKVYARFEWITRTGDKETMTRGFQARASMGKVYLPRDKDWAHELLRQLLVFPAGKNDDKVDVCGLMGMALDQTHPATMVAKKTKVVYDRWDRAFNNMTDEDDSWKTV